MTKLITTIDDPTSRRTFFGMASGLAAATLTTAALAAKSAQAAGKADRLDAGLLALEQQFLRLRQEEREAKRAFTLLDDDYRAAFDRRRRLVQNIGRRNSELRRDLDAIMPEHVTAADRLSEAGDRVWDMLRRILSIPAQSFDGVQVYVRVCAIIATDNQRARDDDDSAPDAAHVEYVFTELHAAIEASARRMAG